jgi:membrane protease YdiL (CAAX protease family)
VLSGLLFGLAHASDPVAVMPLTVLGIGLAVLRLRSGSVVPGLAVHVVNNLIALVSFAVLSA